MLTPLLVLMGALMICFGDAALWKIRAQATVHYASTQTESFRNSYHAGFSVNARPANWPQPASLGGSGRKDIQEVKNQFWNQTGRFDYVEALQGNVRGSRPERALLNSELRETNPSDINKPWGEQTLVVDRQFLAERGVHAGTADITKKFPMLTRLLPSDGKFRVDLESQTLTRDWYFSDLHLGWNGDRRARHLYNEFNEDHSRIINNRYNLEPSKNGQLQNLWNRFDKSYKVLKDPSLLASGDYGGLFPNLSPEDYRNYNKFALDSLDNDRDWMPYHPNARRPPDFHPARPTGCELYLEKYIDFETGPYRAYLASIRRVPMEMAMAWLGTYRSELDKRLKIPGYAPKGPLNNGQLDARIRNLENYIGLLRAYGYK